MNASIGTIIQTISIMALPVIFAVVLHEIAHGYVAYLKGDDTAKEAGRLTLNPIAHIDWFGTVLLPILFYFTTGFLFAFAKPVPVNFSKLKNPKLDMALVAVAGPLVNVILATISAFALKIVQNMDPEAAIQFNANIQGSVSSGDNIFMVPIMFMLYFSVILNVILAVINLIPIPPLDGGRIVTGLLPEPHSTTFAQVERFGFMIIVFLLFINPFGVMDKAVRPFITALLDILL